jgi:pentapeptide repeat protein
MDMSMNNKRYTQLENLDIEDWNKQHKEISLTLRMMFRILLATCIFCVLTLVGSPDIAVITGNHAVSLPFGAGKVPYSGFILAGPVLMVGVLIYSHIFLASHHRLETNLPNSGSGTIYRLPYIFNSGGFFSRFLTFTIFYLLVPFSISIFLARGFTSVFVVNGLSLLILFIVVSVSLVFTHLVRLWSQTNRFIWACVFIIYLISWTFYFSLPSLFTWRLDFSNTNLSNISLEYMDFKKANFYRANLQGTKLKGTNLSYTDFTNANLTNADLTDVDFAFSDLTNANLTNADLTNADLTNIRKADHLEFAQNIRPRAFHIKSNVKETYLKRLIAAFSLAKGSVSTKLPQEVPYPDTWLTAAQIEERDKCSKPNVWRPYLEVGKRCAPYKN